jgi:hypothetical protein
MPITYFLRIFRGNYIRFLLKKGIWDMPDLRWTSFETNKCSGQQTDSHYFPVGQNTIGFSAG